MREVLETTGGRLLSGTLDRRITGVSTDTRTLKRGDLFVALQGERFDGHTYVGEAVKKGACGLIVKRGVKFLKNCAVIRVKDTLKALGDLAASWRHRFGIPVIAVTGSNGKTTTKEMIAALLSQKFHLLKTEGNLNNRIGLPLMLFRLSARHEVAVLEMGMNLPGEISRLAEIASPTVGVITNIGPAHLAGLKSVAGVARAKGELLDRLPRLGVAVLPYDSPFFRTLKRRSVSDLVSFGWKRKATVRAEKIQPKGLKGVRFWVRMHGELLSFYMKLLGRHNVTNALVALAVADRFGLSVRQMQRGLLSVVPPQSRMEIFSCGDSVVINDTYNANPESMTQALQFLGEIFSSFLKRKRPRRVAILGDMLELGRQSVTAHRQIGRKAAQAADLLIAVGRYAPAVRQGASGAKLAGKIFTFPQVEKLLPQLSHLLKKDDRILVKGSRGMKMERVIEAIREGKR